MKKIIYAIFLCCLATSAQAQVSEKLIIPQRDSTLSIVNPALTKDTLFKISGKDTLKIVPKHSPRKATLRSAILPGWGQAYNKEYWKIPIVYGALGATGGIYFYNDTWYKRSRKAYEIRVNNDTTRFAEIDNKLQPLSTESIRFYRNEFRRNRDYSLLYFFVAWGLNVVDATVFAHLKEFDVSEDLSLRINPAINLQSSGLSLVLYPKPASNKKMLVVP